jgi:gas vesicle protein
LINQNKLNTKKQKFMNTTTKVILGLSVAAAAGAAIGMLLAPEKGSDLQKKIKEGVQDWLSHFSGLLLTGKELASEFKSQAQHEVNELKSEFSENK